MSEQAPLGQAPTTGDAEVDRVLTDFDTAVRGDDQAQVEAAARALARLQARLSSSS